MTTKPITDTQRADLQVRKNLGHSHLTNNRLGEALDIYVGILRDYPEDVETYLILGDLYLASQDHSTACRLYSSALQLDPDNIEIVRRLRLAQSTASEQLPEPVPTNSDAIARLLQRLVGSSAPIAETDINRAADLLMTIIHSPNPAEEVAKNLDQIDRLLPALLELNIRQARADGRPDVAGALENLQENIELQIRNQSQFSAGDTDVNAPSHARFQGRVTILVPDEKCLNARASTIYASFRASGCEVSISSGLVLAQAGRPDVVIACDPHLNPKLLESMASCIAARIPLLVDLDADFEHIPVHHPEYQRLGLATPEKSRAYTAALLLANLVTVPNEELALLLREAGNTVQVVPDGWSEENLLWEKQPPHRTTINIGWVGSPGHLEDIAQIRRVIVRVLREFPETQLIIANNVQAYQLFDSLPQNRRLFLPPVDEDDFPYLLGQMDILLVPLQNNPYNHAHSDRMLMAAGVKGIPWIASPMPAMAAWEEGGVVANSLEEWHTYLRQFVMDASLRKYLGQEGRHRAETREVSRLRYGWLDTVEQVVACETTQEPDCVPGESGRDDL